MLASRPPTGQEETRKLTPLSPRFLLYAIVMPHYLLTSKIFLKTMQTMQQYRFLQKLILKLIFTL